MIEYLLILWSYRYHKKYENVWTRKYYVKKTLGENVHKKSTSKHLFYFLKGMDFTYEGLAHCKTYIDTETTSMLTGKLNTA